MDKSTPEHRYRFIELIAWWEGQVNTTAVRRQFGLSRQQANADIHAYSEQAPGNLHYDNSRKAWLPTDGFQRHYISDDVAQYLYWVQGGYRIPSSPLLSHETLQIPARQVSPEVVRGLIAAIRQQRRIEVDYVSLTNPDREGRIIAPHTFVNTGLRWHLRAWCEKRRGYRDFVLSRFRGTPDLMGKTTHTAEHDTAWNTRITLIFEPDPRFTGAKREVIEHDYQMQNGQLRVPTRASLAQYLIQEMQVSTKMLEGTPEAQQLVLVNRDDIKDWLFDG